MSREDKNEFQIVGNVAKDPFLSHEKNMCKIIIATTEWGFERDNYNVKKPYTTYIPVTLFREEYFRVLEEKIGVGDRIGVKGKISIRGKKLEDGTYDEKTSFIVDEFTILRKKGGVR